MGAADAPDPLSELSTERLRLRLWREDDVETFAAMNADPEVMRHFPSALSRRQSEEVLGRIRAHFAARGFGLWAVEAPGVASFIGYVGLTTPRFEAHFTPCVEVGWRLARRQQGHGFATEAARAALALGFERLGLDEIVSFTVPANTESRRVMEKLGFARDPADDFDHPLLPEGHALRRHVLYRLRASAWRARHGSV